MPTRLLVAYLLLVLLAGGFAWALWRVSFKSRRRLQRRYRAKKNRQQALRAAARDRKNDAAPSDDADSVWPTSEPSP